MTHLKLCRYLSPPRSQVSMMMVMMVMVMMVVVEMVAHIRVAQHALGPITAIASIRGHCGRPRWNPAQKSHIIHCRNCTMARTARNWVPLFFPNVFLFFGNKKKNMAWPVVSPTSPSSLPGAGAKACFFSGQQPSGGSKCSWCGTRLKPNATEKQQMEPLMICCGWTSYLE